MYTFITYWTVLEEGDESPAYVLARQLVYIHFIYNIIMGWSLDNDT